MMFLTSRGRSQLHLLQPLHDGENFSYLSYHGNGSLLSAAHWTVRLFNISVWGPWLKSSRFVNNEFVKALDGGTIDVVCDITYLFPRVEADEDTDKPSVGQ
jgi:hypothetical protein